MFIVKPYWSAKLTAIIYNIIFNNIFPEVHCLSGSNCHLLNRHFIGTVINNRRVARTTENI